MAAAEAAAALERLRALRCPAALSLPPLPPAQALRLLCAPGPQRQALLEWLCCRVYPPLAARLDALQGGSKDARLQELAGLGARLMLCRAQDLALVEGTAPPEQQLEFIWDLLAAAPPGEEEKPLQDRRVISEFLHQLLLTPEGRAALRPMDPPPLPPFDNPQPRSPLPSLPALEAALEAARSQLELLEAQNPELGEGSPGPAPPVLPSLALAGGDLQALAAAFGVSELWDTPGGVRPPPPLSPCGALASHTLGGLQLLLQSLGAVAQLGEAAAEVAQLGGGSQHQARVALVAALWQRFGETPRAGKGLQD